MKFALILLLCASAYANSSIKNLQESQDRPSVCGMHYFEFIQNAESDDCYDLKLAELSFKQLLLKKCELDVDDITIYRYVKAKLSKCQ